MKVSNGNMNHSDSLIRENTKTGSQTDEAKIKEKIGEKAKNPSPSARVDLSPSLQDVSQVKESVSSEINQVDMDKVDKFRRLIESGEYKVDAQAVADRMVDEHLMLGS